MGRKGIMENRGGRHDDGMKISRHPISERRDRKRDRKGGRKERERETRCCVHPTRERRTVAGARLKYFHSNLPRRLTSPSVAF